MPSDHENNIAVVLKYFEGCNTGIIEDLLSTLEPDVTHYFLPGQFTPIRSAEHLAKYWRKFKLQLNPTWKIDHILGHGDEVVSEWSCQWTPQATDKRLMMRGTEWYVMRNGRIAEVRAYFAYSAAENTELSGFPYLSRQYLL
jgi:ketosteroid isomerase-like protein